MVKLNVSLTNETDVSINETHLEEILLLILQRLEVVGTVSIEIAMVGDQKIQQLNLEHRQKDCPTDVLSFAAEKLPSELTDWQSLGSIVISTDTAARQAKEANVSVEKEISTLAGHGLLHLLGYHHQ